MGKMKEEKPKEISIDLGGGLAPRPGYINIDLIEGADIQYDLNYGLPMVNKKKGVYKGTITALFQGVEPIHSNSVSFFAASHLLEHLDNIIPLMNDCYEALKPGGLFEISMPYAGTIEQYQDPTHKRAFVENSFLYFAEDSPFKKEQKEYGITARFKIIKNERGKGVDKWQLFVALSK